MDAADQGDAVELSAPPVDDDTLPQDADAREHACALSGGQRQTPARVPGYRILRSLGAGKYGAVWLAREQNTGKHVAIKFYTHRRGLDWSLLSREVEKLAVLYTSRNIVGLLEVGWDSDPPYYIMEYLENGSLASLIEKGPLPAAEAVRITRSVLLGLVHAHGSGILHCDLKPANILLDADLEPRLCDFGQSRLSDDQTPSLGTLYYMAPEQADLKAIPDARWDVYALGSVLYHMLVGSPPCRTPDSDRLVRAAHSLDEQLAIYRRVVRQGPRPTAHRNVSGVDKRLAEIIDRCLDVEPERRFPNAQAVLDRLELRDRLRIRRPMMALGLLAPILLLLGTVPLAVDATRDAVQTARDRITERALESEALSANILARSIERDLEDRRTELISIANTRELRRLVTEQAHRNREQRQELLGYMDSRRAEVDQRRRELGRRPDESWFLTDAEGHQRWRVPYNARTFDKKFDYRDYYHGRGLEYPEGQVPEGIAPIQEPYISTAFRSDATNDFMVAICVPVWDLDDTRVVGVLARTVHLGHLLEEYGGSIRGEDSDGAINRVIALADSRDWELLDHPWIAAQEKVLSRETFRQLQLDEKTVEQLTRLRGTGAGKASSGSADRSSRYIDPVSTIDGSYSGEWLAAFCPVEKTSWIAIVQERKDVALREVNQMQSRMLLYGAAGLVISCGLLGASWSIGSRVLNDRSASVLGRPGGWTRSSPAP